MSQIMEKWVESIFHLTKYGMAIIIDYKRGATLVQMLRMDCGHCMVLD